MTVLDDDLPPTNGEPPTIRDFEGDVPIGPGRQASSPSAATPTTTRC